MSDSGSRHRTASRGSGGVSVRGVAVATATVIATAGVLAAAYQVRELLLLVLVAGVLAIGLDRPVTVLARWTGRRSAVALVLGGVLAMVVVAVAFLVPALALELRSLAADLPGYLDTLTRRAGALGEAVAGAEVSGRVEDALAQAPEQLAGSLGALVGATKSLLAFVAGVGVVLVLTVYLLADLPNLRLRGRTQIRRRLGEEAAGRLDLAVEAVAQFMTGRLLVSAIAGASAFVVLSLLGVPYAGALALLIAVADMVPIVGATLGALLAIAVAATGSLVDAGVAAGFFVVYQHVENYVLLPKLLGRAVRLSSAVVLVSILAGGLLAGVAGALLAVPVAAAVKAALSAPAGSQTPGESNEGVSELAADSGAGAAN